jgi:hypothetical protein
MRSSLYRYNEAISKEGGPRGLGIPMLDFPQFESWAVRMYRENVSLSSTARARDLGRKR